MRIKHYIPKITSAYITHGHSDNHHISLSGKKKSHYGQQKYSCSKHITNKGRCEDEGIKHELSKKANERKDWRERMDRGIS